MKRLAVMVVLSALILLIVYPANEMLGASDEVKIFDKLFQRETGKPRNEHLSIFATDGPATIKVYNGDGEEWLKRATSAEIKINNKTILTPGDFKKKTTVLEKETNLSIGENTIDVILFGMPGVKIRVEISQGVNNNIPLAGLLGVSDKAASEAVFDFECGDNIADSEVTYFTNGGNVVRTKLEIGFWAKATIGEINALLASIDAKITAMLEGVDQLILRIPDPGSSDRLNNIVAALGQNTIVRYVLKESLEKTAMLPDNFTIGGPPPLTLIDNHLAVRAHAAWNAKLSLDYSASEPPLLAIYDGFGGGPPLADAGFNLNVLNPKDFGKGSAEPHGYHVLGIIAADLGGDNTAHGWVTGIYPGSLDVRAVDKELDNVGSLTAQIRLINIVKSSGRKVVINTSIEFECQDVPTNDFDCIEPRAKGWMEKVRGTDRYLLGLTGGLENSFIHLTAAGNNSNNLPAYSNAALTAPFTGARLLTDLKNAFGISLPNLTNTLVIENVINSVNEPFVPLCLHQSSKYHGDLSAIGTDVYSMKGPNSPPGDNTGTSMATPQAAGLAAYVWALKPDLTPQQVLSILESTANKDAVVNSIPECSQQHRQPVIDAYATVLAVDNSLALTGALPPSNAPARLAILDVANSNGGAGSNYQFDEYDIQLFLNAFAAAPAHPDYSRYDLNGDGYTGGSNTARFDLNANYDPNTGLKIDIDITQQIEGQTQHFNENAVTDREILCYYAYSPLFTVTDGNGTLRKTLLAELCSDQEEDTLELGDMKVYNAYNNNLYSCDQAIAYCENLVVNGAAGWRLPTRDELKSMVVCTNGTPTPLENWPMSPCRCGDDNPLPFDRPTAIPGLKVYSNDYWATPAFDTTWWRMANYTSFYSGVSSLDICAYGKHVLCVQD